MTSRSFARLTPLRTPPAQKFRLCSYKLDAFRNRSRRSSRARTWICRDCLSLAACQNHSARLANSQLTAGGRVSFRRSGSGRPRFVPYPSATKRVRPGCHSNGGSWHLAAVSIAGAERPLLDPGADEQISLIRRPPLPFKCQLMGVEKRGIEIRVPNPRKCGLFDAMVHLSKIDPFST